ncbi:MAG: SDR family oxidoreductase [Gammaproteobacteria bacterium]|nr:SDR family oxidoreductase [Gammaproteobacteria bacterium]
MQRLAGKIAIITGASAGIGKASAKLFASEGAVLGLIDINDADGEMLAGKINASGGTARYVRADVSVAAELETAIETLAAEFGGIDVLYNNAGGATPRDDHLLNMPLDEFDRAIGLNLFGPFAGCRFAIPHMQKRGGGSIINTASIRAMIGTSGADGYTAAKGGIVTLTRALALQCADKGIRVNAIAPGAVLTERVKALMAQGNDSGPDEKMMQRHLLGAGEPEQVAPVALFFASDDSRWVTGQILPVDGGASAC